MRLFGKFFGQRPEPEHHGTPREIALSISTTRLYLRDLPLPVCARL